MKNPIRELHFKHVLRSRLVVRQPFRFPVAAVVQVVSPVLIANPILQAWQTWVVPVRLVIWQLTSVATVVQLAPSAEGTFPLVQTLQTAGVVPVLWREKQSAIVVVSATHKLVAVSRANPELQIAQAVAEAASWQLLSGVEHDLTLGRFGTSVAQLPLSQIVQDLWIP